MLHFNFFRPGWIWLAGLFPLFIGCTSSPFGADEIAPDHRSIQGFAKLQDTRHYQGIYVWLEGLNQGTRTNENGGFKITLPPEAQLPGVNSLDGTYKLYFFVANYKTATAQVAIRKGEFLYGEQDLDDKGFLRRPVTLVKILDIETRVEPKWARGNSTNPINVITSLQAVNDSVEVLYPNSIGGLIGGILFRSLETDKVYLEAADLGLERALVENVGTFPRSRRYIFSLDRLLVRLPVGNYEVVPYLFIQHPEVPEQLILSLGVNFDEISATYLNMPFQRKGGHFRVID